MNRCVNVTDINTDTRHLPHNIPSLHSLCLLLRQIRVRGGDGDSAKGLDVALLVGRSARV